MVTQPNGNTRHARFHFIFNNQFLFFFNYKIFVLLNLNIWSLPEEWEHLKLVINLVGIDFFNNKKIKSKAEPLSNMSLTVVILEKVSTKKT